jgi:hypothetical protein
MRVRTSVPFEWHVRHRSVAKCHDSSFHTRRHLLPREATPPFIVFFFLLIFFISSFDVVYFKKEAL